MSIEKVYFFSELYIVGSKVDLLEGVKATDKEDGGLTSKIEIGSTTVDILKEGTYSVTYSVVDSDGNKTTKTISVKVLPKEEDKIDIFITAMDKVLIVGDSFNVLEAVTAKDSNGLDLTSKIEVVKNTVDVNKEGIYEVTYKVSNGLDLTSKIEVVKNTVDVNKEGIYEVTYKVSVDGKEVTKTIKVEVKSKTVVLNTKRIVRNT